MNLKTNLPPGLKVRKNFNKLCFSEKHVFHENKMRDKTTVFSILAFITFWRNGPYLKVPTCVKVVCKADEKLTYELRDNAQRLKVRHSWVSFNQACVQVTFTEGMKIMRALTKDFLTMVIKCFQRAGGVGEWWLCAVQTWNTNGQITIVVTVTDDLLRLKVNDKKRSSFHMVMLAARSLYWER